MHVADGLAYRRQRPRVGAGHPGAHDPPVQEPQDHHLRVQVGDALAQHGVVAAERPDPVQHRVVVWPATPKHAALRERDPLVGQRHLGQAPALVLRPHEVLGRDADVGQERLVEVPAPGHLDDRADLDARGGHVQEEVGDALLWRAVVRGPGQEDPPVGHVGPGRPELRAVHHVAVPVAYGPGTQRRQVGTGLRLAEQLAPVLGVIEHRGEEAPLLGLGATGEDRRSGPSHAYRSSGDLHPGCPELVVDDELGLGIGVAAPRSGPVGGYEPALCKVSSGRRRVGGEPGADLEAAGVVVRGEGEVHGRAVSRTDQSSAVSVSRPSRSRPVSSRMRGATMACVAATWPSRTMRWRGSRR